MALLTIVKYPHPALTTPAKPVVDFDDALHALLEDMAETMYAARGVGLAANQVAVLKRVLLIDTAKDDDPPALLEIINPEIIERDGKITWEEGCLSFPGLYEKIDRAAHVKVRYQDRFGETQEIEGEGLLGVALQHEIDHIDGIVFTERQKPFQKKLALKRFDRIMAKRRAEGVEDAVA